MELGLLFSKVEKKLNDSYINQTFKTEISNFKNIIILNYFNTCLLISLYLF